MVETALDMSVLINQPVDWTLSNMKQAGPFLKSSQKQHTHKNRKIMKIMFRELGVKNSCFNKQTRHLRWKWKCFKEDEEPKEHGFLRITFTLPRLILGQTFQSLILFQVKFKCFYILSETIIAPARLSHPKRKRLSSSYPFLGAEMLVSGRVINIKQVIHTSDLLTERVDFTWKSWLHLEELTSPGRVDFTWKSWLHLEELTSPGRVDFTWKSWLHLEELTSPGRVDFTWKSWLHLEELTSPGRVDFTWKSWLHLEELTSPGRVDFTWKSWLHLEELTSPGRVDFTWKSWLHLEELTSPGRVDFTWKSWLHLEELTSPGRVDFTWKSWLHLEELTSPGRVDFTWKSWLHLEELTSPGRVDITWKSWLHLEELTSPGSLFRKGSPWAPRGRPMS